MGLTWCTTHHHAFTALLINTCMYIHVHMNQKCSMVCVFTVHTHGDISARGLWPACVYVRNCHFTLCWSDMPPQVSSEQEKHYLNCVHTLADVNTTGGRICAT